MNEGSHGTNVQPAGGWQRVQNESWPPAEVARRLSDRPYEEQIPVIVRVVFDTGEENIEGMASRWTGQHVYVLVADQRVRIGGVWVAAADVSRR
jgi:hypothetical protein